MKTEIWALLEQSWFQQGDIGTTRNHTSAMDVEGLPAPLHESLITMYRECFGEASQPDWDDLADFVDALAFAEFGLDSAVLGGRDQLAKRHAQIANWLNWPQGRFDDLTRWWNSSDHRHRFDRAP